MTISERIQLIKAGYTLAEIAEFAAEEKAMKENIETVVGEIVENPVENVKNPAADWKPAFDGLSAKLDSLIKAQHIENVGKSEQPDTNDVSDEDILSTILVPKYE